MQEGVRCGHPDWDDGCHKIFHIHTQNNCYAACKQGGEIFLHLPHQINLKQKSLLPVFSAYNMIRDMCKDAGVEFKEVP